MMRLNNAAALHGRKRIASDLALETTKRSTPATRLDEVRQRTAVAESAEKRRLATGHKFRLGQRVTIIGQSLGGMNLERDYEISRQLPAEIWDGSERQYRIKGVNSGQERMVKENQLAEGRASSIV